MIYSRSGAVRSLAAVANDSWRGSLRMLHTTLPLFSFASSCVNFVVDHRGLHSVDYPARPPLF